MKKMIFAVLTLAVFVFAGNFALAAATSKCTVDAVDGDTVVLDCGSKAGKFAAGQKVKLKSMKKKALEGC